MNYARALLAGLGKIEFRSIDSDDGATLRFEPSGYISTWCNNHEMRGICNYGRVPFKTIEELYESIKKEV